MVMMDYMGENTMNNTSRNKNHQDYISSLEVERSKIQVFHRELPLCLDLVNQAIEDCKRQLYSRGERSECDDEDDEQQQQQQTSSEERPVLEEFIPLKRNTSFVQDHQEEKSNEKNGKKLDWLRSVQLWNQNTDSTSHQQVITSPRIKGNGGAFQPFNENKVIKTPAPENTPSPVPTTSTSSTADNSQKHKQEEKDNQLNRKTRRCWSPELHRRFLQALQQLGGSHAATPKQIRELMKVDGLTNDEVKSHLQKYRLHTRRPGPSMHNNGNSQTTQFVVVGGLWVPPPQDYAVATKGETTSTVPDRIYIPTASPPQLSLSSQKQLQVPSHSGRKSSHGEHSVEGEKSRSGSPTLTSSSTETTTASPNF
ncbi:hypothetical protein ACHQM5_009357 [Ranunculus cassubicifolius]